VTATTTATTVERDWPVYGHDLANTRLDAAETKLTRANVAQLTQRWHVPGLVGVTGAPSVVDGVVYFDDWTGTARAVHADSGKPVWATKLGGQFVGAPAVDGDAVYVSSGHTLWRLNRATGAVRWQVDTNNNPFAQINASPVVVDGLVLQGTASFEVVLNRPRYTFRGSIGAYDATTGKEVWRFYTTRDDAKDGPGAGVWSTPAVDRARGLLFVGSGNAYAEPTGPLADSLLAIDYKTGKLRWSRQFTYPDVFSAAHPSGKDADVGASPNLWSVNGHDLVGAGDKGGTFHALDRDSGKVMWETRLTPGGPFGGEIGSGAYVDKRPRSEFQLRRTAGRQGVRARSRDREDQVGFEALPGNDLRAHRRGAGGRVRRYECGYPRRA
jgi:polyvinyl alcohol dehydrogenase (cytochrome)